MTEFQKQILAQVCKECRGLTWEQICERMAIELAFAVHKMKGGRK
jgi:hypothetical protein